MQTYQLPAVYAQGRSYFGTPPDHTSFLCLYDSPDRVHFHAYPQQNFGLPTPAFSSVLPDLNTVFAMQLTDSFIRAAIDSATTLSNEVEIGGYSIRIVDTATELAYAQAAHYCYSALVRADACLVIWAHSVDAAMWTWSDISCRLQTQFKLPPSNSMVGLPGDTTTYLPQYLANSFGISTEVSVLPSADALSSLSELSFLATPHGSMTPSPPLASANYPTWQWPQNEPRSEGLQLQMPDTSMSSPPNDFSLYSFGNTNTVSLASISPPPVGVFDLPSETYALAMTSFCDISSTFSTPTGTSDGAVSPASSHFSGIQPIDTASELSFHRHSVGEASGVPPPRAKKTKRGDEDGNNNVDCDHQGHLYIGGPAATIADVAAASGSKRRRGVIAKATSAPARITALPNVEPQAAPAKNEYDDDDDGRSSISVSSSSYYCPSRQSLAPPTPGSATSPTLSSASSPASASASASPPAPAPAPRRSRKRAGGSSRSTAGRARRTACDHCGKTFSRLQDAQRHATTSCPDNPDREGVQCPEPECGSVLSRLDAAQRHWRGHKDPKCEPPSWAIARA